MTTGSPLRPGAPDAVKRLEEAVAREPDNVPALLALAEEYLTQGRVEDALDELLVGLAHAPCDPSLQVLFARCCRKSGDIHQARQVLDDVIARVPGHVEAAFELGLIAQLQRDVRAAEKAFIRVTQAAPHRADAWINLGAIQLNQFGHLESARSSFSRALAINPESVEAHVNMALLMQYAEGPRTAASYLERLLERVPDSAQAHWHLAIARLLARDYAEGWKHYEWRDRVYGGAHARHFPYPRWRGESLAGKRILVYGEQGLGDEIMFASCLPEVISVAGQCVIECHSRLASLFSRSFPQASVCGHGRDGDRSWLAGVEPIDFQVPLGSLPLHLRSEAGQFVNSRPYLKADSAKVEAWRMRLANLGPGPKVGLSWRGGTVDTRTSLRSVGIGELGAMLQARTAQWFSLQYGARTEEFQQMNEAHGVLVHHDGSVGVDLDETAALMCALDVVVTVANTNVHLAGALGCPTRVLVSAMPEWRYGNMGETMDWYPSVRLIRQKNPGVWQGAWYEALADLI